MIKLGVLLVCLSLTLGSLSASSSGLFSICDLSNYNYGKGSLNPGVPQFITYRYPQGQVMPWAQKPVDGSMYYTVRSADGDPSIDPVSYYPDQLTTIHLRTLDLDMQFIGLQMYAYNGTTDLKGRPHVGRWFSAPGTSFHNPPCDKGQTISHSDADYKPIHNRFYLNVPKGSGTIYIKSMIKYGEQNKGNFYLPKVLTLTESATPPPLNPPAQFVVSKAMQSCSDACAQIQSSPVCSPALTQAINTPDQLLAAVQNQNIAKCNVPVLALCGTGLSAPHYDAHSKNCYHYVDSCPAPGKSWGDPAVKTAGFNCEDNTLGVNQFCVCSNGADNSKLETSNMDPLIAIGAGGGGLIIVIAVLGLYLVRRKRLNNKGATADYSSPQNKFYAVPNSPVINSH
jgi:hypothetical protein